MTNRNWLNKLSSVARAFSLKVNILLFLSMFTSVFCLFVDLTDLIFFKFILIFTNTRLSSYNEVELMCYCVFYMYLFMNMFIVVTKTPVSSTPVPLRLLSTLSYPSADNVPTCLTQVKLFIQSCPYTIHVYHTFLCVVKYKK